MILQAIYSLCSSLFNNIILLLLIINRIKITSQIPLSFFISHLTVRHTTIVDFEANI